MLQQILIDMLGKAANLKSHQSEAKQMSSPYSHLYTLEDRLDNETARLEIAKAMVPSRKFNKNRIANEIAFRERAIASANKEIAAEKAFLRSKGIEVVEVADMNDDELLAELGL